VEQKQEEEMHNEDQDNSRLTLGSPNLSKMERKLRGQTKEKTMQWKSNEKRDPNRGRHPETGSLRFRMTGPKNPGPGETSLAEPFPRSIERVVHPALLILREWQFFDLKRRGNGRNSQ
jgi:hypothetical protein